MNQANLIQCQVLDPQLKPLLNENNTIPFNRKTLLIKFNSAKLCQVVIKLNQKPRKIVATLSNLQNQIHKSNQQALEFHYFTCENQQVIYNSSINTNQQFTSLQIKIEQDDVAFYNIQLYGEEAIKTKQSTLDNFILKPSQLDNENGTFQNFTNALSSNRDPAGRQKKQVNKVALKQKQELEEAIEKSLRSAEYEKMNQKYIQESKNNVIQEQYNQEYQFQEDEELSLEILMQKNDQQQYSYDKKKQPQVRIENLGYTDKINTAQKKGYQQQWNNSDPIKLNFMTKFKVGDINQDFMKMHQLMEETKGVKRFLENVMYI
ncbi:unnamed protein product [Paramecium primaurelia]|uniref:Uncharacterized protein n=1 Tax=Paramecium primaurelia TaxID=5886 RepID=A0A8S1NDP8_PARPR|nr:unnamed protein product [Paramecium primaurelia]